LGSFRTSKNRFKEYSSGVFLVSSLAGSFIPQSTQAVGGFKSEEKESKKFLKVIH